MSKQRKLHLDWETRSAVDLREVGLYVYARHPSTDILCAGWALDTEGEPDTEPQIWVPGEPIPTEILNHLASGGAVYAENASFELEICNWVGVKYGWPTLDPSQVYCTQAMGLAHALPAGLDKSAEAMGLGVEKDAAGRRIMLQLSQPRKSETVESTDLAVEA